MKMFLRFRVWLASLLIGKKNWQTMYRFNMDIAYKQGYTKGSLPWHNGIPMRFNEKAQILLEKEEWKKLIER